MHPLLERQLREHFGWSPGDAVPPGAPDEAAWPDFIAAIERAYTRADVSRQVLERTIAISADQAQGANGDLRALRRELEARTAEVDGILAGAPHAILITDAEGTILRAGAAVETMLGWAPADLEGESIARIIPGALDYWTIRARREEVYARFRADGERPTPAATEVTALRRDGSELEAEATLADLDDPDNGYRVVVELADLTARRLAEHQARVLQKSEALGTLIAGVAHDFNNILTIVGGAFAAAAADSTDRDRWIDAGRRATDRAITLVAGLLRFARRSPANMAPFDLPGTVQDVARMLAETLDRRITLDASAIDPDLPPVIGDQNELHQVIMNLIINSRDAVMERAVTAGPDFQPTITLRVQGVTRLGLPAVEVEVGDNGGGMPPAVIERVFDPFFTTKPAGKGTGLGLSMAHSIIQNHGGEIAIDSHAGDSHAGAGTTVRFWLPTELPADPEQPVLQPVAAIGEIPAVAAGAGDWEVLVVDDEPNLRDLARVVFAGTHARVTTAGDAPAALDEIARNAFDVALVDVNMPGMDGWQLLERIRESDPGLPVVVVSGYLDGNSLRKHAPAAAVAKPYDAQALLETVARVIEEHRHPLE